MYILAKRTNFVHKRPFCLFALFLNKNQSNSNNKLSYLDGVATLLDSTDGILQDSSKAADIKYTQVPPSRRTYCGYFITGERRWSTIICFSTGDKRSKHDWNLPAVQE